MIKKHVRMICMILAMLVANVLPLPLIGMAETSADTITYEFPGEERESIDARYVRINIDKLDACLYAYLNKDGNVEYRILTDKIDSEGNNIGSELMNVSFQDAVIYDEDQPDILVTVHLEGNDDIEFLSKLSKQQKKQVKKGKLTVETEFGNVTFVVDEYLHPKANESTAEPTQAATNKPETTNKPENTNKPDNTPKPPENTPAPTPNYQCPYCHKWFTFKTWDEVTNHENSCPNRPTPAPTPEPTPSGHYEQHWVVDSPAQTHSEWVCSCGKRFSNWASFESHYETHLLNNEDCWYKVETVVDQEEQGHWETVWVPDP